MWSYLASNNLALISSTQIKTSTVGATVVDEDEEMYNGAREQNSTTDQVHPFTFGLIQCERFIFIIAELRASKARTYSIKGKKILYSTTVRASTRPCLPMWPVLRDHIVGSSFELIEVSWVFFLSFPLTRYWVSIGLQSQAKLTSCKNKEPRSSTFRLA